MSMIKAAHMNSLERQRSFQYYLKELHLVLPSRFSE